MEHAITPGVTGDDRTSLAIFSSQERVDELIEDVKKADSRSESFVSFVEQKAQKLLPLCNNSRLSSIFGGGVWNQLFLATTARVDPSTYGDSFAPPQASADLLGRSFDANVPIIESNQLKYIRGTWLVCAGQDGDTVVLTTRVGGVHYESIMSHTTARSFIPPPPPPAITDVAVSLADYPGAAGMLRGFHACMGNRLSARSILQLAVAVGMSVPTAAKSDQATDSVLRRSSVHVLDSVEVWIEAAADRGEAVGPIPTSQAEAVGRLTALKQGLATAAGAGLGLQPNVRFGAAPGAAPMAAPRAALMAAPLAATGPPPAAATLQRVVTVTGNTRYDALATLAKDEGEMATFCSDVLVWIEPDDTKRAVIDRHEATRLSKVEAWLKSGGDLLDPFLLKSQGGGKDAGDLLAICLSAREARDAINPSQGVTPTPAPPRERLRVHVRTDTGSEVISELERRERSQLASDMVVLEEDDVSMARLAKMSKLSTSGRSGDAVAIVQLQSLVENEPEGALQRIIFGGVEVSAVHVDADPSTVTEVSNVRAVLDHALERSVIGPKATEPSDRLIRALRGVRLFKLGRIKLMNLLDKDDCGSKETPLAQFAKMPGSAMADFALAMSRMQQAFIFTSPANSAQAVGFISELQRKIVIAVAAGVSWEHAGEFYSAVIRKADKQAESFAGSVGGRPAPDVRWVNDQAFEWVAKLGHREEAAASAKEHASALDARKCSPPIKG